MITCALFGVTGDLSKKKLIPALADILNPKNKNTDDKKFAKKLHILGVGRSHIGEADLKELFGSHKATLFQYFSYISGQYDDKSLYKHILEKVRSRKDKKLIVYVSLPPFVYKSIINGFGKIKSLYKDIKIEIYFEKPFGLSKKEAVSLYTLAAKFNLIVHSIDHYKHKGALKAFEKIRDRRNSKEHAMLHSLSDDLQPKITFTALETSHAQNRGAFYDAAGAVRDFFQNHFLQVYSALSGWKLENAIRRPFKISNMVRAQYSEYRVAHGVHHKSNTETFFSFTLNLPWGRYKKLMPVTFRSGKGFKNSESNVIFETFDFKEKKQQVVFTLSGSESIKFSQKKIWKPGKNDADAYISVLRSVLAGDKKAFVPQKEIIAAWSITEKVKKVLDKQKLLTYHLGSDTVPSCSKNF